MALGMTYVRAVEAADALAVVVPPVGSRDVPRLVARLDGLVLSGGPDLAPDAYGARPHIELGSTEPRLDVFEYAMAREALRDDPTVGLGCGVNDPEDARTLEFATGPNGAHTVAMYGTCRRYSLGA